MSHRHKRGIARTQTALLPPAVEDYVGAHALVRVIDCYVDGLDMAALGFRKGVPLGEGRPPYAPDDLLKLYLYGYWNRVRTSPPTPKRARARTRSAPRGWDSPIRTA